MAKPMKEIQGDLTNAKEVLDACEGALVKGSLLCRIHEGRMISSIDSLSCPCIPLLTYSLVINCLNQSTVVGVDCVIHCGALVDISLFPNEPALEAVNVEGTRNVIDACIRQNVPYLVFTSTTDTVVSSNHIFYGAENTTFVPKNFLMGPYAETKHRAEQLVLQVINWR